MTLIWIAKMKIEELLTKIQKIQLKKQKDTAVGLDIGKDSVKLVELVREGETIKLSKIDLAKLTPAQTVGPERSLVVKKIITNLLAKNQIKQKDIILGINGQSVFMKFLEILPVSAEKLDQTIKYEAQQQIPFSLDEVEWDSHLFGATQKFAALRKEGSCPYRVLLVAIKKDKLASKISLVEEIGLRPSILDVSTLSIYNCIRFNQDYDENRLTCVLDIGAQSTDFLILKGDNFWMRSFAFGGDNLTGALEQKFKISFADAEKLKQKMSVDTPIKETVGSVLEDLQGEITRSIEYYYFQQKQSLGQETPSIEGISPQGTIRIDEILLSAGTSLVQGLDKFLAERFSCKVRLVEPLRCCILIRRLKSS